MWQATGHPLGLTQRSPVRTLHAGKCLCRCRELRAWKMSSNDLTYPACSICAAALSRWKGESSASTCSRGRLSRMPPQYIVGHASKPCPPHMWWCRHCHLHLSCAASIKEISRAVTGSCCACTRPGGWAAACCWGWSAGADVTFASAGSCPISAGGSSTGPEDTPSGKSPAHNRAPACHCAYRPRYPISWIHRPARRAQLATLRVTMYGMIGNSTHWRCAPS